MSEEQHLPTKTIESFVGTYIQYVSDGDTYFKALLVKEYLMEMKTHFIDVIEEIKRYDTVAMHIVLCTFFIVAIISHRLSAKRKQPQIIFLQYSCSVTMIISLKISVKKNS